MQLRDEFIVGVYNYCDRWCETCALTSRCRLFADLAQEEALGDPAMVTVANASVPREDRASTTGVDSLMAAAHEEVNRLSPEDIASVVPARIADLHREVHERAVAYAIWVGEWLPEHVRCEATRNGERDARGVIAWCAPLAQAKIYRALTGLASFDGDREYPPDHEGSAKVALVGIDQSIAAWQSLVAARRVPHAVAVLCLTELAWIRDRLDDVFPRARAFVRPGFDEPEALAALRWPEDDRAP